jgi:hypothetical protein
MKLGCIALSVGSGRGVRRDEKRRKEKIAWHGIR